jgi:hypothetical protein
VLKWKESALSSRQKLPCGIKVTDGYLAERFGVTRYSIGRAIRDLDRLGYVQALIYENPTEPKKRGKYIYGPGPGFPPKTQTRHLRITDRQTLKRFDDFYKACVSDWREKFDLRKKREPKLRLRSTEGTV